MKKTLLVGNFGDMNVGDELILAHALLKHPNSVVMTHNHKNSETFCQQKIESIPFVPTGIRSFYAFLRNPIYRQQIKDVQEHIDTIIFPGGGLFAIKFRAYLLWFIVFLWMKKLFPNVPIHFEHQGVDEPTHFLSKFFVRYVVQHSDSFSVRDRYSKETILLCTDQVVQNVGDRVQFQKYNTVPHSKESVRHILINARAPFSITRLDEHLKTLFPDIDYKLHFLAFHTSDFLHAEKEKHLYSWVKLPRTQEEALNIFLDADIIIAERFHCVLLGRNLCGPQNVFTLRSPYSHKVQSFCDMHNIVPIAEYESFQQKKLAKH